MKYISKIFVAIIIALCLTTISFADICFNIEFPGKATLDNSTTKGKLGDLKSSAAFYDKEGLSLVADKMTAPDRLFTEKTPTEIARSIANTIATKLGITDIRVANVKDRHVVLMRKDKLVCGMLIIVRPPNIVVILGVDFDGKHEKEVANFFESFKEIPCKSLEQKYE